MASYQQPPGRLGPYELVGHLATGGMAEIYAARRAGEAELVVVKRLLPELVASKAYVEMFLAEGALVAKLAHPNVCAAFEIGREEREYFLAMPYLDGVPVTELIARPREADRAAAIRVAAGVIVQACAGLHHAHETLAGLVHRDVSPSNLFACADGVVKVLDFGIAKVPGGAETEVGTVKGKTPYMAPEQLAGDALDRRCDVFALGVVLFELATHQRLFKRASDFLAARAILEEPIPRADAVDAAVPAALADVIEKALAREPSGRFADAAAMARAIEAAIDCAGPAAIAAAIAGSDELTAQRTRKREVVARGGARTNTRAGEPPTATITIAEPLYPAPPAVRRKRGVLIAAAGVVIAGVIATLIATCGHRSEPVVGAASLANGATDGSARGATDGSARGAGDGSGRGAGDESARGTADGSTSRASDGAAHGAGDGSAHGAGDGLARGSDDASAVGSAAGQGSRTAGATGTRQPPPAKPGTLSIDSQPYATIAIDGHALGVTPILSTALAAGRHRVHAKLADGRTKDQIVDVPSGRAAPPLVLRW